MKYNTTFVQLLLVAIYSSFIFSACSDNPTTAGNGTLNFNAAFLGSTVSKTLEKDIKATLQATNGGSVDSIKVAQAKILITELKAHKSNEDTTTGDKVIKSGPIVVTINGTNATTFASGSVPTGSYDKMKLEIHRFSTSEVEQYKNDANFGEFVDGNRYSTIISGTSYSKGVGTAFTYRSNVTANIQIPFDTPVQVNEGSAASVLVNMDATAVFKSGGSVYDPADKSNESKIDNAIKSAFKALKN